MATPELISRNRSAVGFVGVVVTDSADTAAGTLLGGHIQMAGAIVPPGASTAAAGTTTADATALPSGTSSTYPVTGADDTKGVRIAATDKVTGKILFIGNLVSNKILNVYAPSGGTINGAAADAAFASASGKGVIIQCLSGSGNTWMAW
jgi:anti-sigma factor RsiW